MSSAALFRPETFGLSPQLTMVGEGATQRRISERANPRMRQAMLEAKALLESAWGGDRAALLRVNEAITTSDLFKSAAGAVMDRELLRAYEAANPQWETFAAATKVRDFKPKTLVELDAPTGALTKVPEHTNYPIGGGGAIERTISVGKFGEQYGYTFEARVNDDIGELETVPGTWAVRARQTEEAEALRQLVVPSTGAPNTGLFSASWKNIYAGALTTENVQAALTAVRTRRDASGSLLVAPELQLVVGPALEFTARRLIGTSEIRTTTGGTQVTEENPLSGLRLTVVQSLLGSAWFILPVPRAGTRSPIYVAKLSGFETPDLRAKADQGLSLGGGAISPRDGSFDDDTVWFRVRHIIGAAQGDAMFALASDGTGTTLTPKGWTP